jgi:hypothetical protein
MPITVFLTKRCSEKLFWVKKIVSIHPSVKYEGYSESNIRRAANKTRIYCTYNTYTFTLLLIFLYDCVKDICRL